MAVVAATFQILCITSPIEPSTLHLRLLLPLAASLLHLPPPPPPRLTTGKNLVPQTLKSCLKTYSDDSPLSDRQQQNRFINTTTKKPEVESVVISMSDFDLKGGGGANVPSFDYARNHTAAAAAETSSFQPSAATTGYKSSSSSSSRYGITA